MTIKYQNELWNSKKVILGEPDRADPLNLLIGFHGAESTAENMLVQGNRLKLKNTLLIFPEGPIDAGEGRWSWWKDGPEQQISVEEFLIFTDGIIQSAISHFKNRSINQISLWGFSQGAAASLVYLMMGSQKIYSAASICGFLPDLPKTEKNNASETSILGIFGLNDEIVPSFLAEHALDEFKSRGYPINIIETNQGHELTSENLEQLTNFFKS